MQGFQNYFRIIELSVVVNSLERQLNPGRQVVLHESPYQRNSKSQVVIASLPSLVKGSRKQSSVIIWRLMMALSIRMGMVTLKMYKIDT